MIAHIKIKSVGDVDKFLNKYHFKLSEVQIVYAMAKFGGYYMVFFDADAAPNVTEKDAE